MAFIESPPTRMSEDAQAIVDGLPCVPLIRAAFWHVFTENSPSKKSSQGS